MFIRLISPLTSKSFFLFGARGVGKSTFIENFFQQRRILLYDLLDPEVEDRFILNPKEFREEILQRSGQFDWVVVDEVQKCPKLLNIVHKLIVQKQVKFALTGSSARRLYQKGTNLLGGRAHTEYLFPLTHIELANHFNLDEVLMTGALPESVTSESVKERNGFLRSYALNYLKHEVQAEQWVRKLEPFRRFLGVAAQMNGKIINYTNIARDIGVETGTVQSYFDILEDTLIGIRLNSYHRSVRKQQHKAPKFYFFDLGVKRALDRTLDIPLKPGTSAYGDAFEHFIILEILRLATYKKLDYELSYLLTKDGAEIDLILDRPGMAPVLVEIKSKEHVDDRDARALEHFRGDFRNAELYLLSKDSHQKRIGNTSALPWRKGIEQILG